MITYLCPAAQCMGGSGGSRSRQNAPVNGTNGDAEAASERRAVSAPASVETSDVEQGVRPDQVSFCLTKDQEDDKNNENNNGHSTLSQAAPAPLPNGHSDPGSPYMANDDDDDETFWLDNYKGKKFSIAQLFPPIEWVPRYVRFAMGNTTEADRAGVGTLPFSITGDLIAGMTVGCMLVPQCLAFAMLAGLPIQCGLYASFMPLLIYGLFGTIRQVQPGPTALMSLITGQALDSMGWTDPNDRMQGAAFVALITGIVSVFLGGIRFGFIVDFMSHSVMTAFCSAAGITIGTSQLKHMLGINMPRQHYWWETVMYLISHIYQTDFPTILLGGVLLGVLLLLKYWKSAGKAEIRKKHILWRWFPVDKNAKTFRALKIVADLSSLLSVLVGWIWGFCYRQAGVDSVKLVGAVEGDGFMFTVPGAGLSNMDMGGIISSAGIMAIVGFLETMAVGGKFAAQNRYHFDPNQELVALGLANVAGAVMSGYPVTGSFSRTAVNATFGATSLVATMLSSLLVLLAALFLLPVVSLLPMTALAPIIIQGAMGVVDINQFHIAYRANRAEFFVMLSTFVVSLGLTVKEGLAVGFTFSILKTMYDLGNPNLVVCGKLSDGSFRDIRNFPKAVFPSKAVVCRMDARLSFTNARKFKEFCLRAVQVREDAGDEVKYVVIDAKSINHVDLTGCETLEVMAEDLHERGQKLIIANLKGPVARCLDEANIPEGIKHHQGYLTQKGVEEALEAAENDKNPEDFQDLVLRSQSAATAMRAVNNPFYQCGTPQDGCTGHFAQQAGSKGDSSPKGGTPKSSEKSLAKAH